MDLRSRQHNDETTMGGLEDYWEGGVCERGRFVRFFNNKHVQEGNFTLWKSVCGLVSVRRRNIPATFATHLKTAHEVMCSWKPT